MFKSPASLSAVPTPDSLRWCCGVTLRDRVVCFYYIWTKFNEKMTEETQQSPEATTTAQPSEQNVGSTAETNKVKEVKKEKCRPMTKVSF